MKKSKDLYNPFRPKAIDKLTPQEICKLFANPNCYSDATNIKHQFLIGGRGSGKSTLLKRLTISSILQAQEEPPFIGIYFPIKLISIEPYLKIWNKILDSRPFEHYFSLNILRSIDVELSIAGESNIRNKFENDVRKYLPLLPHSSSLSGDIENHLLYFDPNLPESPHQKLATIAILNELLYKLSNYWKTEKALELPVSLLIDNYQELSSLAFVINNFMRKENLSTICIKAGTTTISGLWNQADIIEPPEFPQDFEIAIVDNDPEDIKTRTFLEQVINNKLAAVDLTVDKVFSYFYGFAQISSGNPDHIRKLCEEAWNLAQPNISKKPGTVTTFSEKIQINAAKKLSKEYYEQEIPSKDKDYGPMFQSLVFKIKESQGNIYFKIAEEETLPSQLVELIRRGVHKGVFQVTNDERKSTELSNTHYPRDLGINTLLIPYLNVKPDKTESKYVTVSQLLDWAFAKVPGQPGFYVPGRKSPQPDLWDQWQKAFISSPLEKRRPLFISRLRKAIYEVWVSHLQQTSISKWPPKEENFVEDCYDLQKTIKGDFQCFVDERLAKSSFVVHDVTNLTPGVAYEIGFVRGYKKPSFMVWDIIKKEFDPDSLPVIIGRGFHVHQFNHKSDLFKNEVDTIIVESALKYFGSIKCPRHWDKDCNYKKKQEQINNIGFIHCSKIYADILENKLLEKMRKHGKRKPQGEELPSENVFCAYHCAICQSKIVLINYSLNDLDSAFLLGLAAGCKSYAIQLYNESERDEKNRPSRGLSMWGSKDIIPWTPETLDIDLEKLNLHFAKIEK